MAIAWPAHAQTAPSAGTTRSATAPKPPVVSDPTNIDAGKTGEQLFKSNCAICHKTAAGLARAGGILGVQGFLRSHYTASRESAAVIAGYLASVDAAAPPARTQRRPARPDTKPTSTSRKSDEVNPANVPAESKPAEPTAVEPRPAAAAPESRPPEAAPAAPAEQKPADAPKSE